MRNLPADKTRSRSVPVFFLLVLLIWASPGSAGAAGGERNPVFPTPRGYVSDYADLNESDWQGRIREFCKEQKDRTGVEMIVVTTKTASQVGWISVA